VFGCCLRCLSTHTRFKCWLSAVLCVPYINLLLPMPCCLSVKLTVTAQFGLSHSCGCGCVFVPLMCRLATVSWPYSGLGQPALCRCAADGETTTWRCSGFAIQAHDSGVCQEGSWACFRWHASLPHGCTSKSYKANFSHYQPAVRGSPSVALCMSPILLLTSWSRCHPAQADATMPYKVVCHVVQPISVWLGCFMCASMTV
jgi:hypothetical protein